MHARVDAGELHPMSVKKQLAESITAGFHTEAAAKHAAESWSTQFQQKGVADDLPKVSIGRNHARSNFTTDGINTKPLDQQPVHVPTLLVLAGLGCLEGRSPTEAQRKRRQRER